ncbi:MAG: GNAT family N-acetyltransferase [Pseudomonadota bacterium]|nr:GNAT family N-acetyltransferase [Pseudomonadota bacterium]
MSASATPARIRVAPVHLVPGAAVFDLQVAAEQRTYVGDIALNVADAGRDPLSDAMVVLAGERAVGFYRLDRASGTVCGHELGEPTLGLRALFIDRRMQGRGYGGAAVQACFDDARARHPDHHLLVLAVHCCNRAAISTYLRAGFRDTGERLPGGAAGEQILMLKRLRPAVPVHAHIAPDQT